MQAFPDVPGAAVKGVRSIAVMTPYRAQRRLLQQMLCEKLGAANENKLLELGIQVTTVDAFQGNEADIVVFSCVRANQKRDLMAAVGFIGDPKRLNVAITRAKYALWVFCRRATVQRDAEWGRLIANAAARGRIRIIQGGQL